MRYKAVFHVSSYDQEAFKRMVFNAYNLVRDAGGGKVEVAVVVNGSGVKHLVRSVLDKGLLGKLAGLKSLGARFYVCRNSLKAQGVGENELVDFCEVVPAGVTLLVKLQSEGYAYIKP